MLSYGTRNVSPYTFHSSGGQVQVSVVEEPPLRGVHAAGVAVRLLVRMASPRRSRKASRYAFSSPPSAGVSALGRARSRMPPKLAGVAAGAVHDHGVVVDELAERAEAVALAAADRRVEVDAVALVVLGLLERRSAASAFQASGKPGSRPSWESVPSTSRRAGRYVARRCPGGLRCSARPGRACRWCRSRSR